MAGSKKTLDGFDVLYQDAQRVKLTQPSFMLSEKDRMRAGQVKHVVLLLLDRGDALGLRFDSAILIDVLLRTIDHHWFPTLYMHHCEKWITRPPHNTPHSQHQIGPNALARTVAMKRENVSPPVLIAMASGTAKIRKAIVANAAGQYHKRKVLTASTPAKFFWSERVEWYDDEHRTSWLKIRFLL